jgi:ATP-dependent protease HslVU (ClpYQ) peptidase subunit
MMAADSQETRDTGLIVGRGVRKLRRIKDSLVACQGSDQDIALFEHWYSGPRSQSDKPDLDEDFGALVLCDGRIYKYHDKCVPIEVFEEYAAMGSGDEIAMGAMAAGADPERAVEIACELNIYTGPPVVVERL